jgi:hypothetical protein
MYEIHQEGLSIIIRIEDLGPILSTSFYWKTNLESCIIVRRRLTSMTAAVVSTKNGRRGLGVMQAYSLSEGETVQVMHGRLV